MIYILYTIHVAVSLFLILVVLLQQGKGADLSVFGGGGTQTAFGARGAATLLHKLTVGCFVAFIVTTVGIGLLTSRQSGSSVMTDVAPAATEEAIDPPAENPAAEAPAEVPSEDMEVSTPGEDLDVSEVEEGDSGQPSSP